MPKRILALCLAVLFAANPALATWSIVAVNTRTGEVAVASATCLAGDLRRFVPVIRVERGAAAAQSLIDQGATNRKRIRRGLMRDAPPQVILNSVIRQDPGNPASRQYGIVTLNGDPVTFTGAGAGQSARGRFGSFGDFKYAIQGNVLTGPFVVLSAEQAFINTPGDLSQKIMAAMEAARSFGGDGRCSCPQFNPTSCGSPPAHFNRSALNAFIIVSRPGDANGSCAGVFGCANGLYYLNLTQPVSAAFADPVRGLTAQYDQWRANQAGRPDHVNSRVRIDRWELAANGRDRAHVLIQLFDIEGDQVPSNGAIFSILPLHGATPYATVGPVTDEGEGRYSFDFTAGTIPGVNEWRIVVNDGQGGVRLKRTLHVVVGT